MNYPGQNLITDLATNAGAPVKTGFSVYMIIGIVVLFTIFASVVSYSKDLFVAPAWLTTMPGIGKFFGGYIPDPAGDLPNGGPAPVTYPDVVSKDLAIPDSSNVSSDSAEQTWCLVGEDQTGRWCIQVPSVKACDADRTFKNKNTCEGGM